MRLFIWILVLLTACTACSPAPAKSAESVSLNYWEKEGTQQPHKEEYLYDASEMNLFVEAVNSAVELDEPKIITTKPLLSFSILLEKEEDRNFHLWVTDEGEGFLQSLAPAKNETLKLEESTVEPLKDYLASKEELELIGSDIEFEK